MSKHHSKKAAETSSISSPDELSEVTAALPDAEQNLDPQMDVDKSQEEVDMRQEFMDMGQEEVSREQKVAAIWQKELRLLEREVARARRALAPSTCQPYKLAGGQPVRLVPLELLRSGN